MELGRLIPPRCAASSFFFRAADRQHLTTQRDLAGHCHICAHRITVRQETSAVHIARYRRLDRLSALRNFRHVNVDIAFSAGSGLIPSFSARAPRSAPRLNGFLHHFTERAGVGQLPLPGTQAVSMIKQIAATSVHAGPVTLTYAVSLSRGHNQSALHTGQSCRLSRVISICFNDLSSNSCLTALRHSFGDFTLPDTHARFTRVIADNTDNRALSSTVSSRCFSALRSICFGSR